MPTTGIVNGHNLRIFLDDVAVAKSTSCSISITRDVRETSHKDLGTGDGAGWKGSEYGEGSWTITGDALYAYDGAGDAESFETLWDAIENKTKLTIQYSTDVSGDKVFEGSVIITSLDVNAPNNEDVTYSFSATGDGAPTRILVA
jgi:predicted secreted protein